MASFSSSSKSRHGLWKILACILLAILILFPGPSAAAYSNRKMAVDQVPDNYGHKTGFRYQGRVFNFLPKGTQVPPSGPSKRHNTIVNSTPKN
ncbi:hypothetical protein CDL15_Pgr024144 [Punica granatum]|uniref:Uncharacterized protein n=1 Tax=Punica granatum TaxID=22663 RepID=A0A218XXM5_PUNGR|nr:hypothetical protein CDL15_Pgr024144 [Punica granatum]PKI40375.1 hypothetical protein CRG98_039221 [Punica granatum]